MKTGMEAARGLRHKMWMMGIPVLGPACTHTNNVSVMCNMQSPENALEKKSNSTCCHAIREAIAGNEMLATHVSAHGNPADLGTKALPGGAKRDKFVGMFLCDLVAEASSLKR